MSKKTNPFNIRTSFKECSKCKELDNDGIHFDGVYCRIEVPDCPKIPSYIPNEQVYKYILMQIKKEEKIDII